MTYSIRSATSGDCSLLWEFLSIASYQEGIEETKQNPVLVKYVKDWKRPSDFGFIAVDKGGAAIGAAWARQFTLRDEPHFYVDDRHPEVAMGVNSAHQGTGIGGNLLSQLINEAHVRNVGLCLNVRSTNPAVRLYRRAGFVKAHDSEFANLGGSMSFGMILKS